MAWLRPAVWIAVAGIVAASCGGATTGDGEPSTTTGGAVDTSVPRDSVTPQVAARLDEIDAAISTWRTAPSITEARIAAEIAANLVVGPNGPGFGDRNGDGVVGGDTDVGLLPGLDGTPLGLASPLATNSCVEADLLGGSWTDPGGRWDEMLTAIDEWRPDNNTMPTLAAHPMRIVGWATFTQESDSLDLAHEYAGHAKLHVDISLRALEC